MHQNVCVFKQKWISVVRAANCQQASWAQTVGLRGGQLNATQNIAAGRKILDRAVKSVM